MTFSPSMGVRSGGDAFAATRIASSSRDHVPVDHRGTGWTKGLVLSLPIWLVPKHVCTGNYGRNSQIVFWEWSSWMLWHCWSCQEVVIIGMMNGWSAWLKGQTHTFMTSTDVCTVWRHSLMVVLFLLRSHGELYRGESSLIYTMCVTEDMTMESVKVVKRNWHRPTLNGSSTSFWRPSVETCLFGSRSRCRMWMTHAAVVCMTNV